MTGTRRILSPRFLATAAVAAGVLAAGCSGGPRPDVAAVVAGREIPAAEAETLADRYVSSQPGEQAADELGRDEVTRLVLGYLIKMAYLEHLAADLGVDDRPSALEESAAAEVPAAEYQTAGWRPEDFDRSLRAGRLSKAIAEQVFPAVPVSEDELRARYEERAGALAQSWRAAVRMAYFTEEAQARELRARVGRGEPFAAAASALGAVEQGDLGLVTPASPLPEPLLDSIAGLAAGEASGPLSVGGLWGAALVEEREELPALSFEDVRGDLGRVVQDQRRQELFDVWFAKKLAAARVRVDGFYGKWDPDVQGVTG